MQEIPQNQTQMAASGISAHFGLVMKPHPETVIQTEFRMLLILFW
ncbi:uncharacterized protein METZ01_LOCUS465541 [marine metagenome]|uniref:Uncharacterized protein n=1 Tax=marine metagenome TaxID=408172 RepID=A0A383AXX7_9ZZZZ